MTEELKLTVNENFWSMDSKEREAWRKGAEAQLAKFKDNLPDVWDGRGEMMTALAYRKKLEEL